MVTLVQSYDACIFALERKARAAEIEAAELWHTIIILRQYREEAVTASAPTAEPPKRKNSIDARLERLRGRASV